MQNCGLCMRRECRERFPRHRLQWKPLVSDPGMHHGTCVTHVPWSMTGSLTRGGGESVPGIPGACATRNFAYLVRGPCGSITGPRILIPARCVASRRIVLMFTPARDCELYIFYFGWPLGAWLDTKFRFGHLLPEENVKCLGIFYANQCYPLYGMWLNLIVCVDLGKIKVCLMEKKCSHFYKIHF